MPWNVATITVRMVLISPNQKGESYVCFHCSCVDILFNKYMIQNPRFFVYNVIMLSIVYAIVITGELSSRLEKRSTINALCDSVLSYERNR